MLTEFIAHWIALALIVLAGAYYFFGLPRRRK